MVKSKTIKAPKGYHFMRGKSGIRLMKHKGRFKKHKGASTSIKFKVISKHR